MRVLGTLVDTAGCIGWGLFIAFILVMILYLILQAVEGNQKRFSIFCHIVGFFLLCILTFQSSLLVGGIKLRNTCSDISALIDGFIPPEGILNQENAKTIIAKASQSIPFIGNIIDSEEVMKVQKNESVGDAVMSRAYTFFNWYILRRICFILAYCAIAFFVMSTLMERKRRISYYREDSDYSYKEDYTTYKDYDN